MIIGVDLDGIIFNLFLFPNKKTVNKLKIFKEDGDRIVIVSVRPTWAENLTRILLRLHKVPFDRLRCIRFGKEIEQRKLIVIREEKIEQFFDDDKNLVEFLKGAPRSHA